MTALEALGCCLIVYSFPFWMFLVLIGGDGIRLIISMISCLCWLVSALLSSFVWLIFTKITSIQLSFFYVAVAVGLQDIVRIGSVSIAWHFKKYLNVRTTTCNVPFDELMPDIRTTAAVIGFGFGATSSIFSFLNLLFLSTGKATIGIYGLGSDYLFFSAILTMFNFILQFLWTILIVNEEKFPYLDRNFMLKFTFICLSHLVISEISLLNTRFAKGAEICVGITSVFVIVTALMAAKLHYNMDMIGRSVPTSINQVRLQPTHHLSLESNE